MTDQPGLVSFAATTWSAGPCQVTMSTEPAGYLVYANGSPEPFAMFTFDGRWQLPPAAGDLKTRLLKAAASARKLASEAAGEP